MIRKWFTRRVLQIAAVLGLGVAATSSVRAEGIFYDTGNVQFTNVNIASDTDAVNIFGEVGNTGYIVQFNGFGATPYPNSPILLHGQHGVAFVEPFHTNPDPVPLMLQISLTGVNGFFTAGDFKLDTLPATSDGIVTFQAFDPSGNLIPLSSGTSSFVIDQNGQNAYHFTTDPGTLVKTLLITSSIPLADIKQVSLEAVPEPASLVLFGLGGGVATLSVAMKRRKSRAVSAEKA